MNQTHGMAPHRLDVLVVPDCPNAAGALDLATSVVADLGVAATVDVVVVSTDEQAREHGFIGSPSFHLDGVDVLNQTTVTPAVACRVYPQPAGGLGGLPNRAELTAAVETAAQRSDSSRPPVPG